MKTTSDYTFIDYTVQNTEYGNITVPEGTEVVLVEDNKKEYFVNDFKWVGEIYPDIANILLTDMSLYGLRIPSDFVEKVESSTRVQSVALPEKGLPSSEFSKLTLEAYGVKAVYISGNLTVNYTADNGVEISAKVPSLWARTRVLQFMESLLQAKLT